MAMLAGMVRGTPDWQLNSMYEQDLDEAVNKAFADSALANTIRDLEKVEKELEDIEVLLTSCADDVKGTPEEDRITSLRYDVEQVEISIRAQRKRLEEWDGVAE